MKTLLIDDMRNIEATVVARTFAEGVIALKSEIFDVLYLDHDLGEDDPNHTGYGIMKFLEENPDRLPKEIKLVTSNPVGRANMQVVINRLYQK